MRLVTSTFVYLQLIIIITIITEGRLEGLDEPPPDFTPPLPPELVRVVSLPVINNETAANRAQLEITVEEEESSDVSDKDKAELKCNAAAPNTDLFQQQISTSNGPAAISMSKSMDTKIPVNLLIEDQIVKKALNENRRQLEKVSDAIKEIESVKNSESYEKRRRNNIEANNKSGVNNSSKRNSFEFIIPNDNSGSKKNISDNHYVESNHRTRKPNSSDSETSKHSSGSTSSDTEFDRQKQNEIPVFQGPTAGRRIRQNGNDQKQIENVIDAILEDSKNPDFQISVEVLEFPPLPPSPVEEADEESSDVGVGTVSSVSNMSSKTLGNGGSVAAVSKTKSHGNKTVDYRPRVPPHRSAVDVKDGHVSSLNTRSMDAGFSRGRRTPAGSSSRREVRMAIMQKMNDLNKEKKNARTI